MIMNQRGPSRRVLAAFGLDGSPERLVGGEGRSWRCADRVLKHIGPDSAEEGTWVAETLNEISGDDFRLPRAVRSTAGDWIVDGWAAWTWLEGEHDDQSRWSEVLEASRAFHQALADVPRPPFLDSRQSPWDVGDRVAWDECDDALRQPVAGLVEMLREHVRPVALPQQVIHGDVTKNVLFAPDQPPAILDFSPYFRPAAYADAIVLVDAIVWYEAPASILDLVANTPSMNQLLARAAIYRMATTSASTDDSRRLDHEVQANQSLVELMIGRLREDAR